MLCYTLRLRRKFAEFLILVYLGYPEQNKTTLWKMWKHYRVPLLKRFQKWSHPHKGINNLYIMFPVFFPFCRSNTQIHKLTIKKKEQPIQNYICMRVHLSYCAAEKINILQDNFKNGSSPNKQLYLGTKFGTGEAGSLLFLCGKYEEMWAMVFELRL